MNTHSPTHDQIADRARELWQARGQPVGRDYEIWLDAERELSTLTAAANAPSATNGRGNGTSQASKSPADPKATDLKKPTARPSASGDNGAPSETERLRGEMASESQVENQITPALSDDEEIKAALQKRDARSPQQPKQKTAPRAKPPESGKPIWKKPHSS